MSDLEPEKKNKEPDQVTIGEMLAVVKEIWFRIDAGRDMVELPTIEVARMLVDIGVLNDELNAKKFIWRITSSQKDMVNWDDFNSLFATGIFKQSVISKSKSLEAAASTDASRIPGDLLWKLSKHKRDNMKAQLSIGSTKNPDERPKVVRRPMMEALLAIVNKNNDREDFSKFFARLQSMTIAAGKQTSTREEPLDIKAQVVSIDGERPTTSLQNTAIPTPELKMPTPDRRERPKLPERMKKVLSKRISTMSAFSMQEQARQLA